MPEILIPEVLEIFHIQSLVLSKEKSIVEVLCQ